jgi:hypothetical protein
MHPLLLASPAVLRYPVLCRLTVKVCARAPLKLTNADPAHWAKQGVPITTEWTAQVPNIFLCIFVLGFCPPIVISEVLELFICIRFFVQACASRP